MPRILKGQKRNLNIKRRLRSQMTSAELKLWSRLRGAQFLGLKFRRQHGIGPYVVDFYCPAKAFVIEVDGDTHYDDTQVEKDRERDEYLKGLSLRVVRYTNDEVLKNPEGVLEDLSARLSCA